MLRIPDFIVIANTIIFAIANKMIKIRAVIPIDMFVLENRKNPPTQTMAVKAMEIVIEKKVL